MPNLQNLTIRTLLATICVGICVSPAFAQRGRSSSESELLKREEVRSELGLSEEQSKKLEELQKSATVGREFFEPYLKRIGDTKDKEEQSKIRDEMNAAVASQRLAFQSKALTVLKPDQKAKLRGIFIDSAGMRIFSDPAVAKEYGLSEEQLKKLETLNTERRTASRALGFDATEEAREKFTTEWNGKQMAVLTKEQAGRYEKEAALSAKAQVAKAAPAADGAAPAKPADATPSGPVVSSFGGATGGGGPNRVEEFSFNFRGAPWDQVLQMYADGAGLTLELSQIPPGSFNHIDTNTYGPRQTLDILNGALLRKGYVMIETDGFVVVMNVDNGIPPYLIPEVTIEDLLKVGKEPVVGDHQLVTVKIPVDGMETGRAAQEVEPLVGPHGTIVALTESRILIITDVGESLRRIHGLLTMAMSQSKPDAQLFKSYFLKNMDAEEAQIAVMTQFGMQQNVANVSAAAEAQSRLQSRIQQTQSRGGTSRTQTPQAAAGKPATPIQIASDLRLNSLLVTGTAAQHTLVESILASLDVSEGPDGQPLTRDRKGTYLEVYQVKSSSASEVAKTLGAMNMTGVAVVNEDERAGTIHIMATARLHEEVEMLIRKLDGNGGAGGMVDVISLSQMDPLSAAATLRSLFYNEGDEAPIIETDLYRRLLIVRGDIDQITQIRKVLSEMGEDGTGVRQRGEGGALRRFALQGRNPDDFVKILQQAWDANETQKINIIKPKSAGPIRERRTTDEPEAEVEVPASQDNLTSRQNTTLPNSQWRPWRATIQKIQAEQKARTGEFISVRASQTTAVADEPADSEQADKSPLNVIVYGDELILSSPDEEALDRLEDLMDELNQSMPFKPEYTVIYLKSADALEAADMLSQFFPSSSVATTSASTGGSMLGSLGSSLGSMGGSLMDMTGLSGLGSSQGLKIIPDIRTNSLFMTGPQSMIKDALAFLDVIDSDDIPDSLKDMQPHSIQLMYADVRDVETRIKELFKTYTEAQGGNKQSQQNPLAAMFGGGGGKASDPASQVRLLVEAHDQTNMLYVNCNQQLFQDIEGVVKEIDESTRIANPGIKVIQLKHADASMIQESLTNLLPRVSVSSSRTSGSSTTSGSSSGGSKSANPQQDAINRAIQDRIRQQQSGGAGAARGGFGGGGGTRGGAAGGGGGRGAGGARGAGGGRGR